MRKSPNRTFLNYLPTLGIISFVLLYLYASTIYPGGSQADPHNKGFDWMHNYWCNLLSEKAINGEVNPARPFAIIALIVLCFSIWTCFLQFANTYSKSKFWKLLIQLSATFSMLAATFVFSLHNLMTTLSSLFGLFLLIGIIRELYQNKLSRLLIAALFIILFLAINNYIYYTQHYLEWLPLFQKISFAFVLTWVVTLNLQLIKSKN